MLIEKLMKGHVVTATADMAVRQAIVAMAEAGVRHMPVIGETGRLIGMVSQLDLVRAMDLMLVANGGRGDMHVGDAMSVPVFRVNRKTPAETAAALMIEHKIGALPVTDDDGKVVGIVSETDFLEVAREALSHINVEARASA